MTSKHVKSAAMAVLLGLSSIAMAACSAEVGSPEWCAEMKEKPKGEWTSNEAGSFAKHCLLP